MNKFLIILIAIGLGACSTKDKSNITNDQVQTKPFEIRVTDSDYSMAYGLEYVLTDKDLKIIFKGELESEKDSLIFSSGLEPNESLKALSELSIDSLQKYYSNPCIDDGSQITVELKKENKSKTVHLSNYYHNKIGLVIEQINKLVPEKYKIWYDKESLLKDQKNCK